MSMSLSEFAAKFSKDGKDYIRELHDLSRKDPQKAKKEVSEELISMGVLNSDGTAKKQIVTWDC